MRLTNFVIWLSFSMSMLASAEETQQSQFMGSWCTSACFYGSTSRPGDLPCDFEITKDEIRWAQWDDPKQKSALKYNLVEKEIGKEVFLINDGGENSDWYGYVSAPGSKHRLTFLVNHSNRMASEAVQLNDQHYCRPGKERKAKGKTLAWCGEGEMYIIKGSCPKYESAK
ncbi:MAG: hypothetical protein WCZ98_02890 [Sideroxydans sp.]